MFFQVLTNVGVLFVLILVGVIAKSSGILNDEFNKSLSKLVLMITLPVLYFYSLATQFTIELSAYAVDTTTNQMCNKRVWKITRVT